MANLIDLTGQRFGRLLVLERSDHKTYQLYWICECSCDKRTVLDVGGRYLREGKTQSCGCLQREWAKKKQLLNHKTHGKTGTPEWNAWEAMRIRCKYPTTNGYTNYGGRGITICKRWDNFENFLVDMGTKPTPAHTLDRIDVNGNYEPSNCRWATVLEQNRNKRKKVKTV